MHILNLHLFQLLPILVLAERIHFNLLFFSHQLCSWCTYSCRIIIKHVSTQMVHNWEHTDEPSKWFAFSFCLYFFFFFQQSRYIFPRFLHFFHSMFLQTTFLQIQNAFLILVASFSRDLSLLIFTLGIGSRKCIPIFWKCCVFGRNSNVVSTETNLIFHMS